MTATAFTEEQLERYSRQLLLREIGGDGQARLLASSALMVGAGGLGSVALLYLAAAGVGMLGIADGDAVEISNLQRQVIHTMGRLGRNKARSAQRAIRSLNPDCRVRALAERLTARNVRGIVREYDVVLDGSDNFPTRYLVADACWLEGVPLVSAAAIRFEGQLLTVLPLNGHSCYRCLYPEPPPPDASETCQALGVLGPVVGVMGALQAVEALKLLTGAGDLMADRLLVYDALRMRFVTGRRDRNPHCALCGATPRIVEVEERDGAAACPGSPPVA